MSSPSSSKTRRIVGPRLCTTHGAADSRALHRSAGLRFVYLNSSTFQQRQNSRGKGRPGNTNAAPNCAKPRREYRRPWGRIFFLGQACVIWRTLLGSRGNVGEAQDCRDFVGGLFDAPKKSCEGLLLEAKVISPFLKSFSSDKPAKSQALGRTAVLHSYESSKSKLFAFAVFQPVGNNDETLVIIGSS